MDFQRHVECYKKLLENFHVARLLRKDSCGALCDKYHLIIIFQYFMRADFEEEDYTPRNFFLALSLSHDLHDESLVLRQIIINCYLSRNDGNLIKSKAAFHWDKLKFFKKMQYRGFIQRKICQKLCQLVTHKALDKNRKEQHTGFLSNKEVCTKCHCPISTIYCKEKNQNDNFEKAQNQIETPCDIEDISTLLNTDENSKKRRRSVTV